MQSFFYLIIWPFFLPGASYLHDCTAQPKISWYLIIIGAVSMLRNIISNQRNQCERHGNSQAGALGSFVQSILDLFIFAWLICGNVWVYGNYQPNYSNPLAHNYCDKTLYLFAFGFTTAYNVFVLSLLFMMCCVACFKKQRGYQQIWFPLDIVALNPLNFSLIEYSTLHLMIFFVKGVNSSTKVSLPTWFGREWSVEICKVLGEQH